MKKQYQLAVFCTLVLFGLLATTPAACAEGKTRTYYIAVDEVEWDYTPMGTDQMMGMPFDKMAKMYVETDKHQIGRVYRKAVYREYTDAEFTKLKPRAPEWEHLGMLDVRKYYKDWQQRIDDYKDHGLFDDLVTTDDLNGIKQEKIDAVIDAIRTGVLTEDKGNRFSLHHYELY